MEKLNKWTDYDNGGQVNSRAPWESEDPTQEMLERRVVSTQVLRPLYTTVPNIQLMVGLIFAQINGFD